jgi:type I restriction enzyme M protein
MEEEHSAEDGYFADFEKVNKNAVQKRLKELSETNKKKLKIVEEHSMMAAEPEAEYGAVSPLLEGRGEVAVLEQYLQLAEDQAKLTTAIKQAAEVLDVKTLTRYSTLTEDEIKQLVVDDKWMASIERSVKTEMERISQRLTQRIKELAERYETPLPKQTTDVAELETKVTAHLQKMGFVWN